MGGWILRAKVLKKSQINIVYLLKKHKKEAATPKGCGISSFNYKYVLTAC